MWDTVRLSHLTPLLRLACKAHRMVLPALVGDVLEAVAPEMTVKPGRLLCLHTRAIVGCQLGRISPMLLTKRARVSERDGVLMGWAAHRR